MVGVLLVSYGARECSIADALLKSEQKPDLFIADKQRNPFNARIAKEHAVIPGLDVKEIAAFAGKHKSRIDFGIAGPENPIIDGVRDALEEIGVPTICPTKQFAIEGSKVRQRLVIDKACPEANPRFKIFSKENQRNAEEAKKELIKWLDELDNKVAVKPDKPALGKGVGVWGDHFTTREDIIDHFFSIYPETVIVEEKIEGEEFSLQCFTDGFTIIPAPAVRDYKRAFDDDKGPNTGGMGCYKDIGNLLPFMSKKDWVDAIDIGERIFRGIGKTDELRGIIYVAFTCSKDGLKVFEINSRLGMPEAQCIMPLIAGDFVDICYSMIDGNIKKIDFENKASVAVYKVPPTYGGKENAFPDRAVDLNSAAELQKKNNSNLKIYPCSMELKDGKTFALSSRTVCAVGISDTINGARSISMEGLGAVKGNLWSRSDVASAEHIRKSIDNVRRLRGS